MRILCEHGYFKFYPRKASDPSYFASRYETTLVPVRDYFTFEALASLPRYSVIGAPYAGVQALITYEGREPSEVMRENRLVYNLASNAVVPVAAATAAPLTIVPTGSYYYIAHALLQPGGLFNGLPVISYDAEYIQDYQQLKIRSLNDV